MGKNSIYGRKIDLTKLRFISSRDIACVTGFTVSRVSHFLPLMKSKKIIKPYSLVGNGRVSYEILDKRQLLDYIKLFGQGKLDGELSSFRSELFKESRRKQSDREYRGADISK